MQRMRQICAALHNVFPIHTLAIEDAPVVCVSAPHHWQLLLCFSTHLLNTFSQLCFHNMFIFEDAPVVCVSAPRHQQLTDSCFLTYFSGKSSAETRFSCIIILFQDAPVVCVPAPHHWEHTE